MVQKPEDMTGNPHHVHDDGEVGTTQESSGGHMADDERFGTPPHDYQQHHTDVTHPNPGQREFDDVSEAWSANVKRTYDEFQQESLESIRRNRSYVDNVLANANSNNQAVENVKLQALQNAVETANMLAKNSVSSFQHSNERISTHRDLWADRVWNLDEVSRLATGADPGQAVALGELIKAISQNEPFRSAVVADLVKALGEVTKNVSNKE